MMRQGYGCLVIGSMFLASCATTRVAKPPAPEPVYQGSSSWRSVDTAGTQHYELSHDQMASGSVPVKRLAPTYPAAELAVCPPPVEIQAQLIVDKEGQVGDVRVSDEAQADQQRHHYIDAVRAAALQWQFEPLKIGHWVADSGGATQHMVGEAHPFGEIYVFHFECHGGRPSTTVGNAPAS